MQDVIIYIAVGLAALYLLRKYIFKSDKDSDCGGPDCHCG